MEKKPSSDEYIYMQDNTRIEKVIYGRDKETGADKEGIKFDIIPIKKIEQSYIQNCDTLAGIFDGTITKSECFFDGKSRHNKPIEHAIYLDKSARPVHFLLRKIWSQLSDMKIPKASYRNIDKHQWRKLMKKGTVNVEAPEVDAISLDNITDPEEKIELVEHIARIRATYLSHEDLEKIDESNFVEEVWNFPTILDGKTVAIVDEVKSSGATLKIADILMQKAIPEANFEPVYWSVPGLTRWTAYDKDGNSSSEYAASTVPVWYDRDIEGGRMIRDRLPLESQKSESKKQRIGAFVLSRSFDAEHPKDRKSIGVFDDLTTLANKFLSGRIDYVPGKDRTDDDIALRIERYHGMPYKEWRKRRLLAARQKRKR